MAREERRPSALSAALRAMAGEQSQMPVHWPVWSPQGGLGGHRVLVAADRRTRERAYRLAHESYRDKGLVAVGGRELCLCRFDALPGTLTLLIEDAGGREVATVSTVYDGPAGLPCDEVYPREIDRLRARGCRVAEVTRLAIGTQARQAKQLLLQLFNFVYLFTRRVRGYGHLVIEVHPRHAGYYSKLLLFRALGDERPCPRVEGAPAQLLHLDLAIIEAAVKGREGGVPASSQPPRYPYPYGSSDEEQIASFLATNHRPMSREEAEYFGLGAGSPRSGPPGPGVGSTTAPGEPLRSPSGVALVRPAFP